MVYPKNDKRRLYQLMFMYLNNQLVAYDFCREFFECYVLGIDTDDLDDVEHKNFGELDLVAGRYATKDSRDELPGVYFSEEDLTAKIHEVIKALGNRCNFPYSGNSPDNPVFIRKPRS